MGSQRINRTQPALSVEAAFLLVVGVSDVEVDADDSDFTVSDLGVAGAPLGELLRESLPDDPESPPSDDMDDEDAPRLSVL
jgi:hypothetical protein